MTATTSASTPGLARTYARPKYVQPTRQEVEQRIVEHLRAYGPTTRRRLHISVRTRAAVVDEILAAGPFIRQPGPHGEWQLAPDEQKPANDSPEHGGTANPPPLVIHAPPRFSRHGEAADAGETKG